MGPYRSGKTQLLYHIFQFSWDQGIPALYTDALTLFTEFGESDSSNVANWLERRVSSQITSIRNGDSADWLPNWGTAEEREIWEDEISNNPPPDSDYYLLLVDEVEQAYTKLRQSIEDVAPDTDDRNPLRIILDDTEGIYQIWGFGLVSAYEFRGEADAGRFREFRLPIMSPEEISTQLESRGKNPLLATGIWWLARGRIGWVNKFIQESPESLEDIEEWVKDVSAYDFEATRPLDKRVFEAIKDDTSEVWNQARRAILFLENDFDEWTISGDQAIGIEAVQDICIQAICGNSDISFQVKEIIERNAKILAKALSPTIVWQNNDEQYLPIKLLFKNQDVTSFLNLLTNLIISFEGRTDYRSRAIELIGDTDEDLFQDEWLEGVYDYIEELDNGGVWSIKPSIVEEAYPPVAVNPGRLSELSEEEIRSKLEEGIGVEPQISRPHVDIHVKFCPTKRLFQAETAKITQPKNIRKVILLVIPEEYRNSWNLSEEQERMKDYNRLAITSQGGKRFWEFILQLYQYFNERDISLPISSHRVQDAVVDDEDRERRNTIQTLYDQIEIVVENAVEDALLEFVEYYALPGDDVPIWANQSLNSDIPFWSWGGSASAPRTGLSYALVLAERGVKESDGYLGIRNELMEAHDDELFPDPSKFNFKEFLNLVFTSSDYSAKTRSERDRYGTSSGTKHRAVIRFQNFVWDLATANESPLGMSVQGLISQLLKMEPITERESINIIDTTTFGYAQASAFVWGCLLEKAINEGHVQVEKRLKEVQDNLNSLQSDVEKLLNEANDSNDLLSPPTEVGNNVIIRTTKVETIFRNINSVSDYIGKLIEHLPEERSLRSIALTFQIVTAKYTSLLEDAIEDKSGISRISLDSVEELKLAYTRLEQFIEEEPFLSEYDAGYREDALDQLKEQGRDIFDFEAHAGSRRINVDDLDALREIEAEARENLSFLDNLLDDVYELQSLWEERERLRVEVIGDLERFYDAVSMEAQ